jgi:putative inorganic carbon (HCO3(-)) transporter
MARKCITRRTPFDVLILILLLTLPASLYASTDFSVSLPKLTGIFLGAAIFYAVANTMTTWEHVAQLSALLILTAVGVAGFSLFGTNWGTTKFPLISRLYEILPTYNLNLTRTGGFNANQVGGTLILFIPLNFTLLPPVFFARGRQVAHEVSGLTRWSQNHRYIVITLLIISLLLMISTLVLTQSRSALFGLSVALLLLISLRNRWAAIALVALMVLALVGVWWAGPTEVGRLLLDAGDGKSPVGTLNFAGRQEVWSRAVYILQDFPYTGVGLGMFEQVTHVLYPFFLIGPDAVVVHAHNVFLQVGVDLGLPGLVAYVGLITASCAVAWWASRRAPTPHGRAIALGLLGGLVAYHVYGLTDAMTLGAKPGAGLWFMLGLVAALDHVSYSPLHDQRL